MATEVGGTGLPPFLGLSLNIAPLDVILLIGESVLITGPRRAYAEIKQILLI